MGPRKVVSYVWPTLQRLFGGVQSWSLMVSPNPKDSHGGDKLELHLLYHFTWVEAFPTHTPSIVTSATRWKVKKVDFSAEEQLLWMAGGNGRKKHKTNMPAAFLETGMRSWKIQLDLGSFSKVDSWLWVGSSSIFPVALLGTAELHFIAHGFGSSNECFRSVRGEKK